MSLPEMKEIPGFLGYFVTRDGRVFSTHGKGRRKSLLKVPFEMKLHSGRLGYMGVWVGRKDHGRRYIAVHRLILLTYRGSCPPGHECDHKDSNKANNHIDNLEWVTHSENMRRCKIRKGGIPRRRGEKHHLSKLTRRDVWAIRRLLRIGKITQKKIGQLFGVSRSTITAISCRTSWAWLKSSG